MSSAALSFWVRTDRGFWESPSGIVNAAPFRSCYDLFMASSARLQGADFSGHQRHPLLPPAPTLNTLSPDIDLFAFLGLSQ